jgi:hypothetical protein
MPMTAGHMATRYCGSMPSVIPIGMIAAVVDDWLVVSAATMKIATAMKSIDFSAS